MNVLVIGVYGLYLILVGLNGNAGQLAGKVQSDAPKFLPWIIAIFVLAILNSTSETGRKITGPFIFLLILSFVLKRFDTLKGQAVQLWDMAGAASSAGTAPNVVQSGATNNAQPAANSAGFSNTSNTNNAADALLGLENLFG